VFPPVVVRLMPLLRLTQNIQPNANDIANANDKDAHHGKAPEEAGRNPD
jgi:hypothetical protein